MNKNILEFGAVADGVTLNTAAIQNAIDSCSASGGGRVTVPAGVYKTGTIWLKRNVDLHLEMGAELFASDNMDDYNPLDAYEQNSSSKHEQWVGKHLIIALETDNCAITGFGKINGNCQAFVTEHPSPAFKQFEWCHGISVLKDVEQQRPGQLVCFIECTNVRVQDVTIVNSPCWSCYLLGCEFVQIRGLKVFNPIWMLNSDGIDIDVSRYVTVSDCIIYTGDDAITLRACETRVKNKDIHCEHITITNCVLSTGICAFRIGVGQGSIRHARISNIVVRQCMDIVQCCTAYNSHGCANIEDVNFSNISAENTDRCFDVFAKNGAFVKNITLENIRTTATIINQIRCDDGVIDNITVRNLELAFSDKAEELLPWSLECRGNSMLSVKGASNVMLDDVKILGSLSGVETTFETDECEGTDLQKLYIEPETLSAGTSIPLKGNNAALYIFSFDWRTSTHRYNFYGFTINGQNYKWSTETFVVPAGGVTEFVPYYEEVELTTISDDPEDEEPTDDVTTTVKETETKAPDTTKAPETTLPKADDEKSGSCGGFTVAAQLIAVLCSTVAFVVIKKRK